MDILFFYFYLFLLIIIIILMKDENVEKEDMTIIAYNPIKECSLR